MPLSYDPTSAAVTTDVEIPTGGDSYIVTAFSRNGKAAVGPDFSNSDGSYRGMRRVKGAEDASMTIEIENSSQLTPEQFEDGLVYDGSNWVVLQPAKAISNAAAGTITLSLRCADIPGTVSALEIVAGGTGYTAGNLSFSGGGGTGAAGTYTVSSGVINTVTITSAGRGYTTAPTVSVSGGTGATITATIIDPDA